MRQDLLGCWSFLGIKVHHSSKEVHCRIVVRSPHNVVVKSEVTLANLSMELPRISLTARCVEWFLSCEHFVKTDTGRVNITGLGENPFFTGFFIVDRFWCDVCNGVSWSWFEGISMREYILRHTCWRARNVMDISVILRWNLFTVTKIGYLDEVVLENQNIQ